MSPLELKKSHQEGKLTPYQKENWFGTRPVEELYDLAANPHQINNLANNPAYQDELKRHRQILADWIKASGDQGQNPEDPKQLRATWTLWKDKPIFKNAEVNPEYDQFGE